MTILETITEAIRTRKPISFQYLKPGKPVGERVGNPHVIFILPNTQKTYLHLVQTSGVTNEPHETFPKWNQFMIDYLADVVILSDQPSFEVDSQYNPQASMYSLVIEKI